MFSVISYPDTHTPLTLIMHLGRGSFWVCALPSISAFGSGFLNAVFSEQSSCKFAPLLNLNKYLWGSVMYLWLANSSCAIHR